MKVFIKTSFEVFGFEKVKRLGRSQSTGYAIAQYKELLLDAFNTKSSGHLEELPEPWVGKQLLFSLDLENKARLIVLQPRDLDSKTSNHVTLEVLIIGEEDEPTPKRCLNLVCERINSANKRAKHLRISCRTFNLYPVNQGDIAGEDHYFVAKITPDKISPLMFVIFGLITALIIVLNYILNCWILPILIGIPIGVLSTLIFQTIVPPNRISIDIDETLRKETQTLSNITQKNLATYDGPVDTIRRSKDGKQ